MPSSPKRPNYGDRIQLPRRKTLTPEPWGLMSVPGVLSDFQRHASHGNLKPQLHAEGEGAEVPQHQLASGSLISSVPAFVALTTSLLGTQYLGTQISGTAAVELVAGAVLTGLGVISLLGDRGGQALQGSSGAYVHALYVTVGVISMIASTVLLGPVRVCTALIAALNVPLNASKMSMIPYGIFALLFALYDLADHSPSVTALGYVLLVGACYCISIKQNHEIPVASVVPLLSGITMLLTGLVTARPGMDNFVALLISSGSVGVFLLSKRDVIPSRFNPAIATVVASVLGSLVSTIPVGTIILGLLMVIVPVNVDANRKTEEKRTQVQKSIMDAILEHDDTRNIFYFLLLNFSFMLIQVLYSILTHSLGLLSDSIHMFFDCLALLVGLVASILSKFPVSSRFPFGLSKVETVSGFANGCLLVGISCGIIAEALERINHPVELDKTSELLVVSILGLVVNLIGIFAFNHGHGGDGHSHGHSHGGHSHSHGHSHDHSHDHGHSHSHGGHVHENENMYGIFLHIVADTLGSVGVVVSTLLTKYTGWAGFDPVASMFIAVMIFISSIPLITSSAKTLLLSLNTDQEYQLRDALNDISVTSGVAGYTVPKFWSDGGKVYGVLHVQYYDGANSTVVRNKVENRLKEDGIENVFIQIEHEHSQCWCRNSRERSVSGGSAKRAVS